MQLETLHNILHQGNNRHRTDTHFSSQNSLLANRAAKGYQLKFDSYEPFLGAVEEFSAFTFSNFKKNTFTSKIMADFAVMSMFVDA